jgi:RNA processing factor Prp31
MTDVVDIVTVKSAIDEQLKNIFRQLLDLYERHTQERQVMLKEKEELTRLVQLLVNQTKEIGQYENGIRKRIQDCIKDASKTAMQSVEQKMIEKRTQTVVEMHQTVDRCCQDIQVLFKKTHIRNFGWKIIATVVISSIIVSLLSIFLLNILI